VPVVVDDRLLRRFCPHLFGWSGRKEENHHTKERIREHMRFGDSRAAIVVSTGPLLVAAYTDELDCVAMLRFEPGSSIPELSIGSRLLTVNTYRAGTQVVEDLFPGPLNHGIYENFYPIISDFIATNPEVVEQRKSEIHESEWERTFSMGIEYLDTHPELARNGSPWQSNKPASKTSPPGNT
jgi:hypothetical protein